MPLSAEATIGQVGLFAMICIPVVNCVIRSGYLRRFLPHRTSDLTNSQDNIFELDASSQMLPTSISQRQNHLLEEGRLEQVGICDIYGGKTLEDIC